MYNNPEHILHQLQKPKSLLDLYENKILEFLVSLFGEEKAIVAEHLIIMISSILFGYLLCIIIRTLRMKSNNKLRIRFSAELKDLLHVRMEKDSVSELVFRSPRNFLEKLEIYILVHTLIKDEEKIISERKIRLLAVAVLLIFIVITLFIVVMTLLIFNTAGNHIY